MNDMNMKRPTPRVAVPRVAVPRVANLLRSKVNLFALDMLVSMLANAGLHIEILISDNLTSD